MFTPDQPKLRFAFFQLHPRKSLYCCSFEPTATLCMAERFSNLKEGYLMAIDQHFSRPDGNIQTTWEKRKANRVWKGRYVTVTQNMFLANIMLTILFLYNPVAQKIFIMIRRHKYTGNRFVHIFSIPPLQYTVYNTDKNKKKHYRHPIVFAIFLLQLGESS